MDEIHVREGVAQDFNEVMRLAMDATRENAFINPDFELIANQMYAALTLRASSPRTYRRFRP